MKSLQSMGTRAVGITIALIVAVSQAPGAMARDDGSAILSRIRQYHSEFRDLTATMHIQNEDNDALARISPDFAQFVKYGFRQFKYYYKIPDKMRIESTAQTFHFLKGISVRTGGEKNFYIPALGIHKTADVTGQANKKETALDFGILAGDVWDDYNIWYIRSEVDTGRNTYVLGLQPKNEPHGGTMVVRLDAETLRVTERDRYDMQGSVTQRQYFSDFLHPLTHIWIPGRIRLYNNLGQFGGELVYTKVVVNGGLPDSLFR